MSLEEIYGPVARELEMVEVGLLEVLGTGGEDVRRVVSEVLKAGGKRLRPTLLLTAAKACRYSEERSVRLAVALELTHAASLIHDDVIDEAGTRRGSPTVHSRWGNKVSVLAGDFLYATVVGLLADDGDMEVMRVFASSTVDMVRGELMQTLCRGDVGITEEKYLSIIDGKTASLLSCSCRVGAMLGQGHNGEVDVLGDYGRSLGMAFQITDDLLDLVGQEKRMGKSPGNDIREGRLTLPFIHAIGLADGGDRKWMEETFRSGRVDAEVLGRIREMVRRYEGINYCVDRAREYAEVCKQKLEILEDSECRASLVLLADYVVQRVY